MKCSIKNQILDMIALTLKVLKFKILELYNFILNKTLLIDFVTAFDFDKKNDNFNLDFPISSSRQIRICGSKILIS